MYSPTDPLLDRRRLSATQDVMDGSRHSEKRSSYPGVMPSRGGPSASSSELDDSLRRYVASSPRRVRYAHRQERPSASAALDYAFSSQQEQPNIFPASIYREPSRSSSRSDKVSSSSSSSPSGSPGSTSGSPTGRSSLDSSYLSPSPPESRDRSYSPLAAGFARLNQKDGGTPSARDTRGRSGSSKGGLALESKMFSGPA